jgi:hypothetical protein
MKRTPLAFFLLFPFLSPQSRPQTFCTFYLSPHSHSRLVLRGYRLVIKSRGPPRLTLSFCALCLHLLIFILPH